MPDERRFSQDEVSAILERAITAQDRVQNGELTPGEQQRIAGDAGLTLAQIQAIGGEVGVGPEHITRAAREVSHLATPPRVRRWFGLPIGVARTVDLGREMDDREWDQLVVMLRSTFEARGRTDREGGLRAWRNGNLQVMLEPTASGHRLHFMTMKGNVRGMMAMSGMFVATGGWLTSLSMLHGTGDPRFAMLAGGGVALAGLVGIIATALGLPGWARTRARQMEEIGAVVARGE